MNIYGENIMRCGGDVALFKHFFSFRLLFKYILALIVTALVCWSLLFLVAYIPDGSLKRNISNSVEKNELPQKTPRFFLGKKADVATECTGMGIALNLKPDMSILEGRNFGSCKGLAEAAEKDFVAPTAVYARYTHGYLIFLKPLYSLVSVPHVKKVVALCSLAMLGLLFISAKKTLGIKIAAALLFSFLFVFNYHVFMVVTHASQFWLVLAGSILALRYQGDFAPIVLFGVIGALDTFFSFLNMGSLSLGMPLLCYILACLKKSETGREIFLKSVLAAVAWSVGFLVFWLIKWGMAHFIAHIENLFGSTLEIYPAKGIGMIFKALFNNCKSSIWQLWILCFLFLGIRKVLKKAYVFKISKVLLLPILVPIIWICLIPGQSGIKHSSFVQIILWPALAAIFLYLLQPSFEARKSQ